MIHPALLAFDPAVPQRDWLLDEVQMRSRLAALGHGSGEARWQIAKVKYLPSLIDDAGRRLERGAA